MPVNAVGTAAARIVLQSVDSGQYGARIMDTNDDHVGPVTSVDVTVVDGVVVAQNTVTDTDAAVLGRIGDVDVPDETDASIPPRPE